MFELLGVAGIVISVLAYLPQVVHLARQHCSAGVSGRAWSMWLASSIMVGALALHRHDPVFILLQVSTLLSAAVIVVLVHRYRGMLCATHALAAQKQPAGDSALTSSCPRPHRHRRDSLSVGRMPTTRLRRRLRTGTRSLPDELLLRKAGRNQ